MAARKKKKAASKGAPPYRESAVVAAQPAPAIVTWPYFSVGAALICAGAGTLLYPLFLTRTELGAIGGAATYGPIAAVAMIVVGIALSILALNRRGMTEPECTLDAGDRPFRDRLIELLVIPLFVYRTWREIDTEAERERIVRRDAGKKGYDWRPLTVLLSGAVFLALMEYFGHSPTLHDILDHYDPPFRVGIARDPFFVMLRDSPFVHLHEFVWWSGWRVLGFFLLPALIIKLVLRENIADYGLSTAGFMKHAWIYLVLFTPVLGAVIAVSFTDEFSTYYPFYSDASRSWYDFWAWEALYAAQFFSLEFFFRGFWLRACRRMMGSGAIFAMVVPYCMIHFGKPFLETLGAIIAGVILGSLALRTRSIWSGFLIHVSVAVSMDLAALMQTTGWPDRWWPTL